MEFRDKIFSFECFNVRMLLFSSRALLAVTIQSPVTIETTMCINRNRKPYNSFFMANMVSGVDRVHVLPTTPTQWNMATILHLKPSHAALVLLYIYDIENPCYGQLTAVKTRYLLTSIM